MKIIKKSIKDIDNEGTIFYELSSNLSCSYGVGITIRTFNYKLITNQTDIFSMKNFKEIFHDWKDGEPYSKKKIKGTIEISNYLDSKEQINANFSDENSQLTQAETAPYIEKFWEEIATHFTLPPTHVYIHEPDTGSIFAFGIYWQFCYIYLNDKKKEGIVIAADAIS